MSNLQKYHPRLGWNFVFIPFSGWNICGIYQRGQPLSVHIHGIILFLKLVSTHAYLRVLFMKYVAVYRIGVIRSGNCMYDVPLRNLVAFETRLPATKRRKRDV